MKDIRLLLSTLILVVLSLVFLEGCTQRSAEVKQYGSSISVEGLKKNLSSLFSSRSYSSSPERKITVQKNDTVYELSRRYGVSSRDIIENNNLRPPYKLKTGQKLKLPKINFHTVRSGETLYGISQNYGTTIGAIAKANNLKKPYNLNVGKKLRLPNNIKVAAKPKKKAEKKKYAKKIPLKPKVKKKQTAKKKTYKPKKKYAKKKPSKKTTYAKGNGKFNWPTKGKVISRFGTKSGGIKNDGINIAAPEGKSVRASADGVVVYTGNKLKGYGNLLIIRHNGGWLTAYAHQKELKVKKGNKVKRGQVIGKVGKSGNVSRPQLHFAIRKGKKAVDPLKYL